MDSKSCTDGRRGPGAVVRAACVLARLLSFTLIVSCSEVGSVGPARPELARAAIAQPKVGPAPLRRLSNREYLFALQDLFPDQHPALPELPSDADVAGFDNAADGQAASDVRIVRYESVADAYAEGATADEARVRALVGCDFTAAAEREACAAHFIETTGRRLFRRPLAGDERDRYVQRFVRYMNAVDFAAGVRLTLGSMLQAPAFLYRLEPRPAMAEAGSVAPLDGFAMASRLSFLLWESVPDEVLLSAAEAGQLGTRAEQRVQAERMLADPRARRVMWNFHRQWLALDRILVDEHRLRTPAVFADWSEREQVLAALESRLFVENVLSDEGSLGALLTSRRAWLNRSLAALYGVSGVTDENVFRELMLPENERAGLLTRIAFLAGNSHRGATSPPIRANALMLRMLCRTPRPPPPGIDTTPPMLDPSAGPQTNRMVYEARTQGGQCQGCHVSLNGVGFGFEHYNAAGVYSLTDQGLPVDAKGTLYGSAENDSFDGAIELSAALADNDEVYRCAAKQWFRYAFGRAASADEEAQQEQAVATFRDSGGDIRALLLEIVAAPSFWLTPVGEV
jgi:hypothetical protein